MSESAEAELARIAIALAEHCICPRIRAALREAFDKGRAEGIGEAQTALRGLPLPIRRQAIESTLEGLK